MPTLIVQPTRIQAAGNKPKLIDEYVGRVNSSTSGVSVAHMRSPQGWSEPGQTPEFDEFTIVLRGMVRVIHKNWPVGCAERAGGRGPSRRVGAVFDPGGGGRRVHRGVLAGVLDGDGAPGLMLLAGSFWLSGTPMFSLSFLDSTQADRRLRLGTQGPSARFARSG